MKNNTTPRSDKHLEEVTVGEFQPHNSTIKLMEYDSHWNELFKREDDRIRSVLGEKVLLLEHVGSTSVPGLCAKPIIDILLVVSDSSNETSYIPDLETAGYKLRIREPEWFEHRMLKGPDTDIHLHVFSEGAAEIERMLRFRDWLRANETDRNKYASVKRKLAKKEWRHVQHYADEKSSIVKEIMDRADAYDNH